MYRCLFVGNFDLDLCCEDPSSWDVCLGDMVLGSTAGNAANCFNFRWSRLMNLWTTTRSIGMHLRNIHFQEKHAAFVASAAGR